MPSSTSSWHISVADNVVLVDTDVWSLLFSQRTDRTPAVAAWRRLIMTVLPTTSAIVRAYADVRAECRAVGHPLHAKAHMGDAWIAATAVAYGLPLLSGDLLFEGVPRLRLLRHEGA